MTARWSDVDLGAAVLRLRDENAKAGARTVPLSGPVLALLESTLKTSDWVIPNDQGNGPLTKSNVRDAWAAVLTAAKVSDLHIHDLRHAFATRGASLGANALISIVATYPRPWATYHFSLTAAGGMEASARGVDRH